ncbi:MAG: cellulose biosynthesis protein BcsS [Proteobacteria bacterium]|nr:cellulose biosynthesis protein BcsS [Pseudomonadota bacterium]
MAMLASVCLAMPARALSLKDMLFFDTVFSAIEADARSSFLASGGRRSFSLPLQDGTRGFVLMASGISLSDARRASSGRLLMNEIDQQSRLIFGFERSTGPVFTAFGLGPSMAQVRKRWGGGHVVYGVAMNLDIWIRPREDTYITLHAAADVAARNWWSRARLGYRFAELPFALGPEVVASTSRDSGKVKLGLHLGEAKLWKLTIDIAGGVMWDHNLRPTGYVSGGAYMRY